ncbi:Hypothetical predicted protein [Cloeon dipterum]|uniref:Pacifastin domain-containing protein n=1 Tax=Cloeon dipterum TaxID=197152 RepID=A0A8S1CPQ4_9INSE|nr:Hypothetical predicted protein [Cloeon dipterum]
MAPRLLLALLLFTVVASSGGERGREIRRRVRVTTTTTPVPSATASESVVNDDKQICEGEPGCEWSCNRDQPDPNTNCMCSCAAPDPPKEDHQSSYDGSYFGK